MVWLIGYNNNIVGSEVFQVLKKNNIKFYYTDNDVDYSNLSFLNELTKNIDLKYVILCNNFLNQKEDILNKKVNISNIHIQNIIDICNKKDLILITTSTNEVFNGEFFNGYTEDVLTSPVNDYGRFFSSYEDYILSKHEKSIILRTSPLFGKNSVNYIYYLLKLIGSGKSIDIVDDETFSPTYALDLAKVIGYLVHVGVTKYGIFHCTNVGRTDWFDYSQTIYNMSLQYGLLPSWIKSKSKLVPISHTNYITDYKRPQHTYLVCDKLKDVYNINMRSWESALDDFFKLIQKPGN